MRNPLRIGPGATRKIAGRPVDAPSVSLLACCTPEENEVNHQCGDESACVKSGQGFERQIANARGERRDHGRARSSVHLAACVAGHDAPLIGERAATRGRRATASGDERAGAKSAWRQDAPCW